MRNWYFLEYNVLTSSTFFVGHYLWGIDTFSNPKSSSGNVFFSSDITYEELIPFLWFNRFNSFCLSDITYEELIPYWSWNLYVLLGVVCRTLPMRNWYESKIISFWMNWISRTLPMRNWHVYGIRTFQFVLSSGITFPTRIPCANT